MRPKAQVLEEAYDHLVLDSILWAHGGSHQVTAVSPLTERGTTYVRPVRELGAGNGPLPPFVAPKMTPRGS